jgi:hypothetical protein
LLAENFTIFSIFEQHFDFAQCDKKRKLVPIYREAISKKPLANRKKQNPKDSPIPLKKIKIKEAKL